MHVRNVGKWDITERNAGNRALNFHVSDFFFSIAVLRKLLHIIGALKCILTVLVLFIMSSKKTEMVTEKLVPTGFPTKGRVIYDSKLLLYQTTSHFRPFSWWFFFLLLSNWFAESLNWTTGHFCMFTRVSLKNEFFSAYTHVKKN